MPQAYTEQEKAEEVKVSMEMERLTLTEEEPGAVEQVPESGRQRQIQGGDPGRIRGGINE